jgi:hypothetical protein
MDFLLFLLMNVVLFIRPAELVPGLAGLPIYECLILTCAAASGRSLVKEFAGKSLAARPITTCVIGLLVAVPVSHLSHFAVSDAWAASFDFFKVVVYYLLFVTVVNSPARLRALLMTVSVLIVLVVTVSLLQYYEVVNIPGLEQLKTTQFDEDTEEELSTEVRLCGTGIFNNPNDLSRIVVVGIMLSLYWVGDRKLRALRPFWLAAVGVLGYALVVTYSRGGVLALLGGITGLLGIRFGRWAIVLAAVALPLFFFVFKGRQTDFDTREGTSQQRIQIWNEGFILLRESPLFGIGKDNYVDQVNYVAHNSYVHCYTELGLVGGTFFTGAFYLALSGLCRLAKRRKALEGTELARLLPYVIGMLAGYIVGMFSSSLSYKVPTYMLLGLATVYVSMASAYVPDFRVSLDRRLLLEVIAASVCVLVGLYVFVRFSVQYG